MCSIIMSFPGIALAAVFVPILGNSVPSIIFAIGYVHAQIARIVHCKHLSEYGENYVEQPLFLVLVHHGFLWKHVLRNCIAPIMVLQLRLLPDAIIFEAS